MTGIAAAAEWLASYLSRNGGRALSSKIKSDGVATGHHEMALKRARQRLKLKVIDEGFPRVTYWALPDWEEPEPEPEPEVPIRQPEEQPKPQEHVDRVKLSGTQWGHHARQRGWQ